MTATIEEERVELLARDLEGDEFTQARGHLRTDDGHCCLGVACERYRRETGQGEWQRLENGTWVFSIGGLRYAAVLPIPVQFWYGFTVSDPFLPQLKMSASTANDGEVPFGPLAAAFREGWGPGSGEWYTGNQRKG